MTPDGWQVLTALPHTAAVLLRGALHAEGITAELDRDALSTVYGLDVGAFATRILVPDAQAQRAQQVVSTLDAPA